MGVGNRRCRQPDWVRVATLDVAHSYRRSAVVVGPVDVPPVDTLAARFTAMASVGPHTRVGLQPSTASRRWRYAPNCAGDVVATTVREPGSQPIAMLSTLRHSPAHGIRILAGGDHLAIDFSHGLGEVLLLDRLVAVLLGALDPDDPAAWKRYRTAHPLLTAGICAIGLGPHRLLPLWRQSRRNAVLPEPSSTVGHADPGPSPATRVAQIPAAVVAELRARRDEMFPGVSMFALYTCALHRAFAATGFDVHPAVTVPFDVRRYLPRGWSTLASFSAGLDFALQPDTDPGTLQERMTAAARMARPVANLVVGTAKMRVAMRRGIVPVWEVPVRPRLRLLHSTVGTVPRASWNFTDPAQAQVLVASDPVGPCGVTVTTASVLGSLWLTAEFHDTLFDEDRVGRALDTVADFTRAQLRG